jgi:hypothetical protein
MVKVKEEFYLSSSSHFLVYSFVCYTILRYHWVPFRPEYDLFDPVHAVTALPLPSVLHIMTIFSFSKDDILHNTLLIFFFLCSGSDITVIVSSFFLTFQIQITNLLTRRKIVTYGHHNMLLYASSICSKRQVGL